MSKYCLFVVGVGLFEGVVFTRDFASDGDALRSVIEMRPESTDIYRLWRLNDDGTTALDLAGGALVVVRRDSGFCLAHPDLVRLINGEILLA